LDIEWSGEQGKKIQFVEPNRNSAKKKKKLMGGLATSYFIWASSK